MRNINPLIAKVRERYPRSQCVWKHPIWVIETDGSVIASARDRYSAWEAAAKVVGCKHVSFDADVSVNRIEDIGRFMADVTIHCRDCGVPFVFLGLPLGLDYNSATVGFTGTECRLAIAPKGSVVPPLSGVEGFSITKEN